MPVQVLPCAAGGFEMTKQESEQEIRALVSKAYADALKNAEEGSASGSGCGSCCGPTPAGSAAQLAGYKAELARHGEAARASFGCGNPLAMAGVIAGQTVLDLGSGAGFDLLIAAEKVGEKGTVIGVDMTAEMLAAAEANARKAGYANIELRKGIIEELPVKSDSVDWVISNCVINLSPRKERVFSEIARVLRPGGAFSISDIVVEELPDWVRNNQAAYAACVAGAISERQYLGGLEAAGLSDVGVAERMIYEAEQLRAIVGGELAAFGFDPGTMPDRFDELAGKVWSARFTGRKAV